jgi:hypothetical protein
VKTTNLIVRCYAEHAGDQWQAFCVDYCLAAQAASFDEAKQKLEGMICEYVYDALEGDDQEYADQFLLNRPAPLRYRLKYNMYRFLSKVGPIKDEVRKLFMEPIPLVPSSRCRHAH